MNRLSVLHSLRSLIDRDQSTIERIHTRRAMFARLSDVELRAAAPETETLADWIALAAAAARRVLGQEMYDVQLRGALALARGSIIEMQTGEGKDPDRRSGDLVVRARPWRRPCDDGQ